MTSLERKNFNFMKFGEKTITIPVYHKYPHECNLLEHITVKIIHKDFVITGRYGNKNKKKIRHFDSEKFRKHLIELGFLNVTTIHEENITWSGMIFTFPAYICIKIDTDETSMPEPVVESNPQLDTLRYIMNLYAKIF